MSASDEDSLAAVKEEWEQVATVVAGGSDDTTAGQSLSYISQPDVLVTVTAETAVAHFRHNDQLASYKRNIKPSIEYGSLRSCLRRLFGPPSLKTELTDDRDLIFSMALWPLENSNQVHISMLYIVYRSLVGTQFNPARFGNHWDDIGFQGVDPATDLRGSGCLGLVNLLHLVTVDKYRTLCRKIFTLSRHSVQNFPFCVMSLNMTRIAIQVLRNGLLNKIANKSHDVVGVFNEFYVAAFWYLYTLWYNGQKTIHHSGHVLKDVESRCHKNPENLLKDFHNFLEQPDEQRHYEQPIEIFTGVEELCGRH